MAAGLIFITGASGFIGSATALAALKAGYRLRVCLRKPSETLEAALSEYSQNIEYVIVPDITDEAAFKGKLDGADYVLHLASPLTHGIEKESYFGPAVKGTNAVLNEATRVPSIKKVVVTSSIAALIPLNGIPEGGVIKEDNDWDFSVDEAADFTDPSNPAGTAMRLYRASKLLANNASWELWKTAKPHYALVTIHPSFVFGQNLVQTSAEQISSSSNGLLWGTIMTGTPSGSVTGVHIQDVAEAHVKALNPEIADGSKYLISGNKATWGDVAHIVKKHYPNLGAKISADIEGSSSPTDTTKAEKDLKIEWRSLEQMVREVVDQQLGFVNH
ncbi:uncharacterized protein N7443_001862 [Penicillium atrosanguineum]|uniref:uncharacterized protein n=1 Tax=Penicillium atrosanguineum TaxID=1132637 RepID=UPI00238365CB|nr:uncharacterized protein N7443_001862 [Penicillium atrosanguineum]KAJ5309401.1 hypothetical protein N7443_001862 [Penicillium atrosanguineum]